MKRLGLLIPLVFLAGCHSSQSPQDQPASNNVWTVSSGQSHLQSYNLITQKNDVDFDTGHNLEGQVIRGDDSLWVTTQENTLLRVNRYNGVVESNLALGKLTHLTGDGDLVWAINSKNQLLRIDAVHSTVSDPIPLLGENDTILSIGKSGNLLYALIGGNGFSLLRYDTVLGGTMVVEINGGAPGKGNMAVGKERVYVVDQTNSKLISYDFDLTHPVSRSIDPGFGDLMTDTSQGVIGASRTGASTDSILRLDSSSATPWAITGTPKNMISINDHLFVLVKSKSLHTSLLEFDLKHGKAFRDYGEIPADNLSHP